MMKFMSALALTAFLAAPAYAQDEGNADAGKALAEANCSRCHNIAPGGAFKLYPPSFAAIAAYMDPDIIRLRILHPDHQVIMPQFHAIFNQTNIKDLTAYIRSLEE